MLAVGHERTGEAPPSYSLGLDVTLAGRYDGSGQREAPYLIRRGDGSMVEVSPLLYLVAAALDGRRDAAAIAAIVSAGCDRPLSADNIDFLVADKLAPLGLLWSSAASPRAPMVGLVVRGAVVPRRLVRAAANTLRGLFRPFVVATVMVSIVVVDVWMARSGEVGLAFGEVLQRPASLLFIAALTIAAAAFHELGHAAASRYGGAEPGVIGVGVYLLWPVLYNDLNDSYRLSRRGRLRVDLGGVYFNAVFVLAVMVAYAVSGQRWLVVVAIAQHLAIAQQFIPFVRLDGYYIVADLAGVPDLFRYTRAVLASLLPRAAAVADGSRLRPGVETVVAAWVLGTICILVAGLVVLVMQLPDLLRISQEAAAMHVEAVRTAWNARALLPGLLGGLQLVLATVPVVGLSAAVLAPGLRLARSRLVRPRSLRPAGTDQTALPEPITAA